VVGTKTNLLMLYMMSMISALYGIVSSHGISKSCFYFADLLFHLLSEPELGNNLSTIGELSKRLVSRRPNVEPILSQQFLQHGTNIVVETSASSSTSVDQNDVTGLRNEGLKSDKKDTFGRIFRSLVEYFKEP
jgi:hypothetical protein